ncbi:MAG: bifunctional diguanylate cyclase/phosphodiesterase [Deferribacteres bacterium]|nr:bifunctional diguanylate cyclase/phosphodiesterase [Deferribacteres bacterium]
MEHDCCLDDSGALEKIERIFYRYPLPILVTHSGVVVWMNSFFKNFSGYSLEEVRGKSPEEAFFLSNLTCGVNFVDFKKKNGDVDRVLWYKEREDELELHILQSVDFLKELFKLEKRYDPVTGLLDRLSFIKELDNFLALEGDLFTRIAVLVVDVVDFSEIATLYGMCFADRLLALIAERIRQALRKVDIIGRVGVDDFGVVLGPVKEKRDILKVVDRLFSVLKEPFVIDGRQIEIAVNIAVAVYPEDGISAHQLLDKLHLILYRLKLHKSKNAFSFFKPEYVYEADVVFKIKNLVPKAIENKEFVLFYQPIVDMRTRAIKGCEALLRWISPELYFIPPMEFLPILERMDLIYDVSFYVLREVCLTLNNWLIEGVDPGIISFNLSPVLFRNNRFLSDLSFTIKSSGVREDKLCVEITESAVFEFEDEAVRILGEIKKMGCKIAIDDFGTGYSTLKHIVFMPADLIKVDRFFIAGLPDNERDIAVVKTVKTLAESIGAEVVAEGVERREQEEFLINIGFRFAQGFLYAKPMPKNEMKELLKKGGVS